VDKAKSNQVPAWISALVSVGALLGTIEYQYYTRQVQIKSDLVEHRRQALFAALEVIDNVFGNEPLTGGKPPYPHKWDIKLAHDADNQMRIYCKYPETLSLFRKTLALHNPDTKSPGVDLQALDDFRLQVAKELDLPKPIPPDRNAIWIYGLSGAVSPDSVNTAGGGQTETPNPSNK
jgi:hypothetical protein